MIDLRFMISYSLRCAPQRAGNEDVCAVFARCTSVAWSASGCHGWGCSSGFRAAGPRQECLCHTRPNFFVILSRRSRVIAKAIARRRTVEGPPSCIPVGRRNRRHSATLSRFQAGGPSAALPLRGCRRLRMTGSRQRSLRSGEKLLVWTRVGTDTLVGALRGAAARQSITDNSEGKKGGVAASSFTAARPAAYFFSCDSRAA